MTCAYCRKSLYSDDLGAVWPDETGFPKCEPCRRLDYMAQLRERHDSEQQYRKPKKNVTVRPAGLDGGSVTDASQHHHDNKECE